eukprot:TRINITY_DN10041_c0_g1_i1.p1 TRINITY_DN10041_c0_g1~~TRINITY_DN10041_c0_g1_i1.p1  ORF type:complete len:958 (+),score=416.70 TRINITY_DN10041_c0_g1_i1:167-3040(+)
MDANLNLLFGASPLKAPPTLKNRIPRKLSALKEGANEALLSKYCDSAVGSGNVALGSTLAGKLPRKVLGHVNEGRVKDDAVLEKKPQREPTVDDLMTPQQMKVRESLNMLMAIVEGLPAMPNSTAAALKNVDLKGDNGRAWVHNIVQLYEARLTAVEGELMHLVEKSAEASHLERVLALERKRGDQLHDAVTALLPLNYLNQKQKVGLAVMANITKADLDLLKQDLQKSKKEVTLMKSRVMKADVARRIQLEKEGAMKDQMADMEKNIETLQSEKGELMRQVELLSEDRRFFEARIRREAEIEIDNYKAMIQDFRNSIRSLKETATALSAEKEAIMEDLTDARKSILGLESARDEAVHKASNATAVMRIKEGQWMIILDAYWTSLQPARLPDPLEALFKTDKEKEDEKKATERATKKKKTKKEKEEEEEAAREAAEKEAANARDAAGLNEDDRKENDRFDTAGKELRQEMIHTSVSQFFKLFKTRGDVIERLLREASTLKSDIALAGARHAALERENEKLEDQVKRLDNTGGDAALMAARRRASVQLQPPEKKVTKAQAVQTDPVERSRTPPLSPRRRCSTPVRKKKLEQPVAQNAASPIDPKLNGHMVNFLHRMQATAQKRDEEWKARREEILTEIRVENENRLSALGHIARDPLSDSLSGTSNPLAAVAGNVSPAAMPVSDPSASRPSFCMPNVAAALATQSKKSTALAAPADLSESVCLDREGRMPMQPRTPRRRSGAQPFVVAAEAESGPSCDSAPSLTPPPILISSTANSMLDPSAAAAALVPPTSPKVYSAPSPAKTVYKAGEKPMEKKRSLRWTSALTLLQQGDESKHSTLKKSDTSSFKSMVEDARRAAEQAKKIAELNSTLSSHGFGATHSSNFSGDDPDEEVAQHLDPASPAAPSDDVRSAPPSAFVTGTPTSSPAPRPADDGDGDAPSAKRSPRGDRRATLAVPSW